MKILKLALPLAGLLMATQALAHKASHATAAGMEPVRPTPAQTDSSPAALLGSIGGHGVREAMDAPAPALQPPPEKNRTIGIRINRLH
jgi:hypothetical protein